MTSRKNVLKGSRFDLRDAAERAHANGARFPLREDEDVRDFVKRLERMLFDDDFKAMVTAKSPEGNRDVIQASAVTFYGDGISVRNLAGYPERYELNSNIVAKPSGRYEEQVWRAGLPEEGIPPGLYAEEIEAVIGHLEAAMEFAPDATRRALQALVRFYRTGEREDRVAYDQAWVADTDSTVDTINGFVEVYMDPRGKKGSWEGIVFYEDPKKAELIKRIASQAQWFEDHMPYDDAFKKPDVKGITARSIDVVIETGDSGPVTPIGINLPNDSAIREHLRFQERQPCERDRGLRRLERELVDVGVLLGRRGGPEGEEVAAADPGPAHEHARGDRPCFGAAGSRPAGEIPASWIKEYYSTLEEGRADLIALYFMMDPKLEELGLVDNVEEAALATYEQYTRNGGMLQLRRLKDSDQIEEDHMRNRQMVVRWIMANSDAIEERERGGKRYLVVRDPKAWREGRRSIARPRPDPQEHRRL